MTCFNCIKDEEALKKGVCTYCAPNYTKDTSSSKYKTIPLDQELSSAPKATHSTVLDEVKRIVYSDRAVTHGDFKDNFEKAASIYNAWTGSTITALDINKILQALKMAREECNPGWEDNLVDQLGYITLRYRMKYEE
jgi:hypothetical protein